MYIKDKNKMKMEIYNLLTWLGQYGEDPKGGVSRLLYSSEWKDAQSALEQLFVKEGLEVKYDEVGNLFGKLPGTKYLDETIMSGSHIDTVNNGGIYDGQYGIIAAFIAIVYLKKNYGLPLRNIEVASFAEEEGSRFPFTFWGSKNLLKTINETEMVGIKDLDGIYFTDAMRNAGFNFKKTKKMRTDLRAFVELHIEQGKVLEIENKSIGIVDSIVGERRYTIDVIGEANHAGTTPMKYRKDAVQVASKMFQKINDIAEETEGPLVATIGKIEVEPNITNVIPGKISFTLDVRHTNKDCLHKYSNMFIKYIREIASSKDMTININIWTDEDPVQLDKNIINTIEEQCINNNTPYKLMHSGAGHDTQIIAPHVPSAMLFVPSKGGISHSPQEHTSKSDLLTGVIILIKTLFKLSYSEKIE